jgi:cytochrome P450
MLETIPTSDVDPYCDEVLADPYPHYAELRAAGDAVYLRRYDAWALPRYSEVRAALDVWETFSAADGVGVNEDLNRQLAGSLPLTTDPPAHDAFQRVLSHSLAPRSLDRLRVDVERHAAELVGRLVRRGSFDAVTDLAAPFVTSIVSDLIGLPAEGRDRLLAWADSGFNNFGPLNDRTVTSMRGTDELFEYASTVAVPGRLAPCGIGAAIYEAAERGELDRDLCPSFMAAYLTTAMLTTVSSIASALWLFARNPDEWRALRDDPSLVPSACNEVLRLESPFHVSSRSVRREHELRDATLPAGSRVLLLFASANRDERKWDDPARFDVRRNPRDHVAFGHGVHSCPGQGLARLEAQSILAALASAVETVEAGEPTWQLNNVVRAPSSLPVSVLGA